MLISYIKIWTSEPLNAFESFQVSVHLLWDGEEHAEMDGWTSEEKTCPSRRAKIHQQPDGPQYIKHWLALLCVYCLRTNSGGTMIRVVKILIKGIAIQLNDNNFDGRIRYPNGFLETFQDALTVLMWVLIRVGWPKDEDTDGFGILLALLGWR